MITMVHSRSTEFTGRLDVGGAGLQASTGEPPIDTASIQTHNAVRDAHLRSPDVFDVERRPAMTFRSTRVRRADTGRFCGAGVLTTRAATRPVDLISPSSTRTPTGTGTPDPAQRLPRDQSKLCGLDCTVVLDTGRRSSPRPALCSMTSPPAGSIPAERRN